MSKNKNKNSTVKILALFISILLWSYVRGEDSSQSVREFKGVNVTIINEKLLNDSGLVVVEPKEIKVNVKVSGRRSDVNSINKEDISAQVDLANAKKGTNTIPIKVDPPLKVSLYDVNIRNVSFEIDSMVTVKRDIELNVAKSSTGDNIKENTVSPRTIEISGPSTYINKISKVIVDIDVDKVTTDGIMKLPVRIVDSEGKEIKEVTSNIDMVEVSVSLVKSKQVNIKAKLSGSLKADYKITSMTVNPKTVIIKGLEKDISGIEDIETEDIDLTNIVENSKVNVRLKLPEGVQVDKDQQNVLVDIKIADTRVEEDLSKEINIDIGEINLENIKEGFQAKIDESIDIENISMKIKAKKETIDNFNMKDLKLTLDLNDLEEGIHSVELKATTLQGIEIESLNPSAVKVNIEPIEGEEEPL